MPFDPLWLLNLDVLGAQNGAKSTSKLVNKFVCIFDRFGGAFWFHFGSLWGTQNCAMNSLEYNQVQCSFDLDLSSFDLDLSSFDLDPCSFDMDPCSFDLGPWGPF